MLGRQTEEFSDAIAVVDFLCAHLLRWALFHRDQASGLEGGLVKTWPPFFYGH
jgi:hypothetical protein